MSRSRRLLRRVAANAAGTACLVACLLAGCAKPSRWSAPDPAETLPDSVDAAVGRRTHPSELPDIPPPTHFRPCCAFGSNLRVRVGFVPVPGFDLLNVVGPDRLGHHRYDNGLIQTAPTVQNGGVVEGEHNGLVYTCRGGFIDVAHVRNWVDWSTFLASRIARDLAAGTVIELPSKGGRRTLRIRATDPAVIERVGRLPATIPLAQWAAYQVSIWDEISTWYGWSHLPIFSERSSAFSPEDLYSDVIGIKIMAAILAQEGARTEPLYDESVDHRLRAVLRSLGAVDRDVSREATRDVEGLWWDARRRIPDMDLVRRRNVAVGMPLVPWLIPRDRMSPSLRAACGDAPEPLPLAISESDSEGVPFSDRAALEITVGSPLKSQEPFRSMNGRLTQADFPALLDVIRAEAHARFGARACEPE
ncbi:MAG TPA: DUF4056 domain-containing protein [Candidatus Binatia bacterium]|nr:DUF4056 domain-containing protein [Candidatus Binatia bacterium]